jgi:hypothetical protein
VYASAAQRAKQGERTISMDELTGVQAIERKFPDLPMQPGHVLRREFEYIGHGTLTWFINFDVVTGEVIVPSWGPTRTEEDALAHLERLIASDPEARRWHIMVDNLNTHQSEAWVRWMAQREGIAPQTLGVKGQSGIVHSMESRAAFLHDPTHQIIVYYTRHPCVLDESGRNLAQYSRAQDAQTRQFSLRGRLARPNLGLHRLLQSHGAPCRRVLHPRWRREKLERRLLDEGTYRKEKSKRDHSMLRKRQWGRRRLRPR